MLTAAGRTHTGRVRSQNEDALLCRPEEGLFAVVDGMGGEQAGEVAAAIAVAVLGQVPNRRRLEGRTVLRQAFEGARAQILAEAQKNPDCRNMGAVATALRLDDQGRTVAIAHVGDTRAYLVNRAGVRQLTTDHLAPAPDGSGRKAAVARDLGRAELPADWVELHRVAVQAGDLLVICSDGLYEPPGAEELEQELRRLWRADDPDTIAARLIALALARGGPDNISVVVARVGRFRRATRVPRLGLWASVGVLAALCMLAAVGAALRAGRAPDEVPGAVSRDLTLSAQDVYHLGHPEGDAGTAVAAGRTFTLRGTAVEAPGWAVTVGEGGSFVVDRTVLRLAGELHVSLGKGASFEVRDSRIQGGSLRVDGDATNRFQAAHAGLPDTVLIGEAIVQDLDDVRYLVAPAIPTTTPPAGGAPGDLPPPAGTPPPTSSGLGGLAPPAGAPAPPPGAPR